MFAIPTNLEKLKMTKQQNEVVTRTIPFPKELKEYLETKAKESMRTFVSEVVYRLKKAVEAEQDINR